MRIIIKISGNLPPLFQLGSPCTVLHIEAALAHIVALQFGSLATDEQILLPHDLNVHSEQSPSYPQPGCGKFSTFTKLVCPVTYEQYPLNEL